MHILVSNDDGVSAPGIAALAEAVTSQGKVTVVAPSRERSTTSHSLTLHKPLRAWETKAHWYATNGSPADCVYLATLELLRSNPPDWVVSGINAGANLGTDVHYSGTVAAAREATLLGYKAAAFSLVLDVEPDEGPLPEAAFARAGKVAHTTFAALLKLPLPPRCYWNVNIPNLPPERIKGVKLTRQGIRRYTATAERRSDPRGKPYFWIGGPYQGYEPDDDSDCHAVQEGWVAVSPLGIDVTSDKALDAARAVAGSHFPLGR